MTNKSLISGIILFVSCIACNKVQEIPPVEEKIESKYCVNYIRSSPDTIFISEDDLIAVKSLFDLNHIVDHSFQFYGFQHDNLGYYHVRCNQFVNGLQLFRENLIFHFKPDKTYSSLSGDLIAQIDLDTIPSMAQDSVIEKYLEELDKDDFYKMMGDVEKIKQGCFDIEFGYFDLNDWMGIAEPNYIKAWKVNPKGRENPHAYINDLTSTLFSYDNGVRQ